MSVVNTLSNWWRIPGGRRLHYLPLINLLLVVFLATQLARLAWDLLDGTDADLTIDRRDYREEPGARLAESGHSSAPDPAIYELFGVSATLTTPAAVTDEPVPATALNLKLKGILVDANGGTRLALIARPGQTEEVYRPGDNIEGARITAIEAGRVILNRNGVSEALYLDMATPPTTTGVPATGGFNRAAAGGIRQVNAAERVVSRQFVNEQLRNLPGLLRQAKTAPYAPDGEMQGFRVVEIDTGSIFAELGLQKDDVIRSVNGNQIQSVEEAMRVYRTLRTAKSFKVQLWRDGREVVLDYTVR